MARVRAKQCRCKRKKVVALRQFATSPTYRFSLVNLLFNLLVNRILNQRANERMITFNLGFKYGGYNATYTALLARCPVWPIDAWVLVQLAPLALELKVALEVEGFKMEFTVVKL